MRMRQMVVILLALSVVAPAGAVWAAAPADESTPEQVVFGVGSVLSTIVYSPFKASFCVLGGIGSALTAIVSTRAANQVVAASCRGTWAITPDVLRGKEPVSFVGDSLAPSGADAR